MRKTKCLYPEGASPEGMVSATQLQSWMACAKRWEYGYLEGLAPRVERPYLIMGKLCHVGFQAAMERLWLAQRENLLDPEYPVGVDVLAREGEASIREEHARYMDGIDFLPEELPEFERLLADALDVFGQALGEFDPLRWEVLTVYDGEEGLPALELHFKVPCAGSKGLHGYVDAILRDRGTGHAWCVDYKFRSQLEDPDEEQFSLQNAIYMRACERMGVDVVGTLTWQHLNVPAADPALTKSGVSRARVRTTWARYREFVEAQGLDPADYAEMEQKLADVEWFREVYEHRSPETVRRVWDEVVVPAAWGIRRSAKGGNRRALFPWNCRACQFRELCQAELRGYDADDVRQRQYTRKEHRK